MAGQRLRPKKTPNVIFNCPQERVLYLFRHFKNLGEKFYVSGGELSVDNVFCFVFSSRAFCHLNQLKKMCLS